MTPRELSFIILWQVLRENEYANRVLSQLAREKEIEGRDRAFLWELTLGVIRWLSRIDWFLKRLVKGYDRLPLEVKILLRMGSYQLIFMDKVPPYSAVDETMKLAKKWTTSKQQGLINAVLRRVSSSPYPVVINQGRAIEVLSIAYAHPVWLLKRWRKRLSMLETLQLCRANNTPAPFSIWVNSHMIQPGHMKKELKSQGIECKPHPFLDDMLIVLIPVDITQLPQYVEGLIHPQDPASSLVVKTLDPQPGETILDACAGPGIKMVQMAWSMENRGRLVACDIHPEKISQITENRERSGITVVEPHLGDVTEKVKEQNIFFDRILLDAPCSDLGTIRRHPELKWRRRERDITLFSERQRHLLINLVKHLKPGGILVYSICSTEPEEGEALIKQILDQHSYLEAVDFLESLPQALHPFYKRKGLFTIYPHYAGTDGFFIAKIRRCSA